MPLPACIAVPPQKALLEKPGVAHKTQHPLDEF
jgi:hypothetical protein